MEVELLSCPRCGESKLVEKNGNFVCPVCNASFTPKQKDDFVEKMEELRRQGENANIGKLRAILRSQLEQEHLNAKMVVSTCLDILRIMPDDFKAGFYHAFFTRKAARKEYHAFLHNHEKDKLSAYDKRAIYPFLIDGMDFDDQASVNDFLKAQGDFKDRQEQVKAALKRREEEADLFADVHRDVFICHKHQDLPKILPIIEKLEKEEGLECWYSERNLANDRENYEIGIENAIERCDIFVLFLSQAAKQSPDCQKEVTWAMRHNKQFRIEYRLEEVENSRLLKECFEGREWIDASYTEQSEALIERIYEQRKAAREIGQKEEKRQRSLSAEEKRDAAKLVEARKLYAKKGLDLFECYDQCALLDAEGVPGAKQLQDMAFQAIYDAETHLLIQERDELPRRLKSENPVHLEFAERVYKFRAAHVSKNLGPLPKEFLRLFNEMNAFILESKKNKDKKKEDHSDSYEERPARPTRPTPPPPTPSYPSSGKRIAGRVVLLILAIHFLIIGGALLIAGFTLGAAGMVYIVVAIVLIILAIIFLVRRKRIR